MFFMFFFFCKQKTAYEMRISDWSSDVCSSDLARQARENERLLADFVLDRASLRRDRANELLGEDALATHKDLATYVEDALAYHGGVLQPHVDGGQVVSLSPNLATRLRVGAGSRSEEHTSELQSLMRISYAVFCLKKTKNVNNSPQTKH